MASGAHKSPGQPGRGRPRPFLWAVTGLITLLEWSGRIIAFSMLAFTFVTLFVNVTLRYAFGSGIAWAYEIHAVSLPWLVAAGIVIATAQARNIAITLLPDLLNDKLRFGMFLAVNVAIAVIALSVLVSSEPILKASTFQTLSTLGIKQVWGYASIVYAFGAMVAISVATLLRVLLVGLPDETHPEHMSLS